MLHTQPDEAIPEWILAANGLNQCETGEMQGEMSDNRTWNETSIKNCCFMMLSEFSIPTGS